MTYTNANKFYSEEEKELIRDNYKKFGAKKLAAQLGRKQSQISGWFHYDKTKQKRKAKLIVKQAKPKTPVLPNTELVPIPNHAASSFKQAITIDTSHMSLSEVFKIIEKLQEHKIPYNTN